MSSRFHTHANYLFFFSHIIHDSQESDVYHMEFYLRFIYFFFIYFFFRTSSTRSLMYIIWSFIITNIITTIITIITQPIIWSFICGPCLLSSRFYTNTNHQQQKKDLYARIYTNTNYQKKKCRSSTTRRSFIK